MPPACGSFTAATRAYWRGLHATSCAGFLRRRDAHSATHERRAAASRFPRLLYYAPSISSAPKQRLSTSKWRVDIEINDDALLASPHQARDGEVPTAHFTGDAVAFAGEHEPLRTRRSTRGFGSHMPPPSAPTARSESISSKRRASKF